MQNENVQYAIALARLLTDYNSTTQEQNVKISNNGINSRLVRGTKTNLV